MSINMEQDPRNPLERQVELASTTGALPIAVSMGPAMANAELPAENTLINTRVILISLLSIGIGIAACFIAQALMHLIWLITNISFFSRWSFDNVPPAQNGLGLWVIVIPVIGGIIVGFMARYGSKAIRGHGIPEAMEQVLLNQSRIPPRLTFLKPVSAAIAIGTGGPFGAEGPIIATGGALGSLVGQLIPTTAMERKTLLAAGAAAGMAATFGSPVSAVLLAIELLLFEFRARSIIPVALASTAAAGIRIYFDGVHPVFDMPNLTQPAPLALWIYIILGSLVGVASVFVTRAVYAVEDAFEQLPIHWMWWPAIGAVAVGICGYFSPRTLGVGYYNITGILCSGPNDAGGMTLGFIAILCAFKFVSWAISLGSGTSGGTLAPLFTIGGGLGALLGAGAARLIPDAGVDIRIAALVGMAAIFAGASRALLASVVFAFETTLQPLGLLPLLGGCSASFLVSCLLMRNTIMTEKIARRGVRVPAEYAADFLDMVLVRDVAAARPVTLPADQSLDQTRVWLDSGSAESDHQGFPVVDPNGILVGIVTRRQILDRSQSPDRKLSDLLTRPPIVVYSDCTLRDAADHMVNHDIGRLPVIERGKPGNVVGMITRSDLLSAHRRRLNDLRRASERRDGSAQPTREAVGAR